MDLQSADIDDATAAAGEVITIAATLDDIAGIDETVGVGEPGSPPR